MSPNASPSRPRSASASLGRPRSLLHSRLSWRESPGVCAVRECRLRYTSRFSPAARRTHLRLGCGPCFNPPVGFLPRPYRIVKATPYETGLVGVLRPLTAPCEQRADPETAALPTKELWPILRFLTRATTRGRRPDSREHEEACRRFARTASRGRRRHHPARGSPSEVGRSSGGDLQEEPARLHRTRAVPARLRAP